MKHACQCLVSVPPVDCLRDLGVLLDSDMSMKSQVQQLICSCFGVLRQLRSIRRSLPRPALASLVTSLILSKVDYCNVALAGLPQRDLDRVQSVLNAAARLTAGARKYDHVTPLLHDLHWLRVPERITYKLCVLVHRGLHGAAPRYLSELVLPIANIASRRRLRSASTTDVAVPATRRCTIGDRAFAAAGPRAWNSLPPDVRSAQSVNSFKKHLKSHLFRLSYP